MQGTSGTGKYMELGRERETFNPTSSTTHSFLVLIRQKKLIEIEKAEEIKKRINSITSISDTGIRRRHRIASETLKSFKVSKEHKFIMKLIGKMNC